jgi:hypothetical protein
MGRMSEGRVHLPERAREIVLARRDAGERRASTPRVLVGELEGTLGELRAGLAHGWRGYLPRLAQLRREVAQADDATYAAARAWAEAQRATAVSAYAAVLAFLFDAEPWCDEVLRAARGTMTPTSAAVLALVTSRDADLVADVGAYLARDFGERVLERGPEVIETFAARPAALEAILFAWGEAIERAVKVARGSQRAWDLEGASSRWLDLLAHVGTPAVAARIATGVGKASSRPLVTRYFRRFPELAEGALGPLAKGRGKVREAAATMLAALAPPRDERITSPSEVAPRLAIEIASDDAVPEILREPPWRHWKRSGLLVLEHPPCPTFDLPPEASAKHDREAWAAKLPTVSRVLLFSSRAASPVAHAWSEQPAQREAAEAWLRTFAPIAIYGLLPMVLGDPGATRALATRAMRLAWSTLAPERGPKIVERWAEDVGAWLSPVTKDDVVRGVSAILEADGRWDCPARAPTWPSFLRAETLPPVRTRGGRALPPEALAHLVELAIVAGGASGAHGYPGVAEVRAALDPRDLEAFSLHVLEAWRVLGQSTRASWPLEQVAHFGGRSAARALAALVRTLATERALERALETTRVLERMRDDGALVHLHLLAESARNERVRATARTLVESIAKARGLAPEELEDLLVPDPSTLEEADPKTAKAELDGARKAQGKRLERAMCVRRAWPAEAFLARVARHPLLGGMAAGLVWARRGPGGEPETFRIAEDGSLASVEDELLVLAPEDEVWIPHPLELSAALRTRWGQVMSDYQLVQPFAQLGRETFELDDAERAGSELQRLAGRTGETAQLYGLEQRGWAVRGMRGHASIFRRALRDGLFVELVLEPVDLGRPKETPTFTADVVRLGVFPLRTPPPTFRCLTPVEASEILRDLAFLNRDGPA